MARAATGIRSDETALKLPGNLRGSADRRFDGPFDPAVIQRGMLASKVNSSFRLFDRLEVPFLLAGIEQREASAKVLHVGPHDARAAFNQIPASDFRVEAFRSSVAC